MKITVVLWNNSVPGLKYKHGQEIDGTEDDAFLIARECFSSGQNIMVKRVLAGLWVCVDDRGFSQR